MSRKSDNIHAEHRERLRQKFLKNGEILEEHEMLELLLFFSIPQADTNPLAHELLNHFGTLESVLEADERQLQEVKGIGPRSAVLIRLISSFSRMYLEDVKTRKVTILNTPEMLGEYMKPKFVGAVNEMIYILTLDSRGSAIRETKMAEGAPNTVNINVRKAIEIAMKDNADSVAFFHNHPRGFALPSQRDFETTAILVQTFRNLNMQVKDHIVYGGDLDFVSIRTTDQKNSIFSYR